MIWVAVVVASLVALWFAAERARTVARCRVAGGDLAVIRGALPTRVTSELRDVVKRNKVDTVTFDIVREDGRPRLVLHGEVSAAAAQQLRNVVGRFKLAELRG